MPLRTTLEGRVPDTPQQGAQLKRWAARGPPPPRGWARTGRRVCHSAVTAAAVQGHAGGRVIPKAASVGVAALRAAWTAQMLIQQAGQAEAASVHRQAAQWPCGCCQRLRSLAAQGAAGLAPGSGQAAALADRRAKQPADAANMLIISWLDVAIGLGYVQQTRLM